MNTKADNVTMALIRLASRTDMPQHALAMMRLSCLDWLSVALAGLDEPVAAIVRNFALSEGGAEEAGLIGSPIKLPARAAALVNGTLSHALDYDDTHFAHIGHPSVAILPAAFAIGEKTGAKLQQVLEAALIGCEASIRLGVWLGRTHYQHGFHQTATAGSFGATLAACRLLGLDETKTGHALGLVATRASGLKSQFGTMGKPFHAGMAASNGVEAALLARAGFTSQPDAIGGPQGFGLTHAGANDFAAAFGAFAADFLFENIQHKFHACCHGTHAALEALSDLRNQYQPAPPMIAEISIDIHPRWLSVCNIPSPQTGLEAKFSYRLTAAACLGGYDTAALATFSDQLCQQPDLLALRDKVRVNADTNLAETAACVSLTLNDQTNYQAYHDLMQPIGAAEREQKLRKKSAALVGTAMSQFLWHALDAQSAEPLTLQGLTSIR